MNNKEMLLEAAERAAEFINKNRYSNFISIIQDTLSVAKHSYKNEHEQKQKFYKLLDSLKNSSQIELLSGGKNIKNGFKEFLDEYLKLNKKEEYIVENEDFKDCTVEEMEYIFGWIRRLVKRNRKYSNNNNSNNNNSNNNNSKNSRTHSKNKEIMINSAMQNELKRLNLNSRKR